jgi:hypothetical protein
MTQIHCNNDKNNDNNNDNDGHKKNNWGYIPCARKRLIETNENKWEKTQVHLNIKNSVLRHEHEQ